MPLSYLRPSTGAPSIIFYYPLCDVEAAGDCAVVEFICGDYAQLTMWLNDFDNFDAWKLADLKQGSFCRFGSLRLDRLSPVTRSTFSELNASWNLKFYAIQDPKPWLQKLKDNPKVTIATGKGEIVVPQSPDGVANLQTFVASCGAYEQ